MKYFLLGILTTPKLDKLQSTIPSSNKTVTNLFSAYSSSITKKIADENRKRLQTQLKRTKRKTHPKRSSLAAQPPDNHLAERASTTLSHPRPISKNKARPGSKNKSQIKKQQRRLPLSHSVQAAPFDTAAPRIEMNRPAESGGNYRGPGKVRPRCPGNYESSLHTRGLLVRVFGWARRCRLSLILDCTLPRRGGEGCVRGVIENEGAGGELDTRVER